MSLLSHNINDLRLRLQKTHKMTTSVILSAIPDRIDRSSFTQDLISASVHHFGSGKGFRPGFLELFYSLFGSKENELVYDLCAAIELLHTSSLVHDDWMDGDTTRRGKKAVWKRFDPTIAVLTGDYLVGLAMQLAGPFSSELGDTYSKLCIGQQMDIAFETRSIDQITVQDSLEMLRLKTSMLFELSCDWGARLAGATEDQLYFVNAYARSVGMAFQLRDDILNIIATPEIIGKPRASDLINGKKTPLAIATYHNARPKEQGFFADYLGKIENKNQLADMTSIISLYGLHSINALMSNYIRTAKWAIDQLSKFDLDREILDLLYIFAEYSIERQQ